MSLFRDKMVRSFFLFIIIGIFVAFLAGTAGCGRQMQTVKDILLMHDSAVSGSLIAQGVPEETIASAITSTEYRKTGADFLAKIGVTGQTKIRFLPCLFSYYKRIQWEFMIFLFLSSAFLLGGTAFFFRKQEQLYRDAAALIHEYMEDHYSRHLPQLKEGAVYEMFSAVDQLLMMQHAKNETEQKTKQFLKQTISDISHQLKTPLAALFMYQEIMEEEPENPAVIKEFSVKMKAALTRMERLIQSMLKITRLDAGSILFEKRRYQASEVIWYALGELTTRAGAEKKKLVVKGNKEEELFCDMEWTAEAVANLVKNALDHTSEGDCICVSWESTPEMSRIMVSDEGCGISDDDIYHIFKRFYRSKNCPDTQGIGLGLPLAKAIVEGQNGVLSVRSSVNEGTTFVISLPYEIVS